MNTKSKLRVAAYCRVSTDKDDQTNSLISQRKYFADYITHHDAGTTVIFNFRTIVILI